MNILKVFKNKHKRNMRIVPLKLRSNHTIITLIYIKALIIISIVIHPYVHAQQLFAMFEIISFIITYKGLLNA